MEAVTELSSDESALMRHLYTRLQTLRKVHEDLDKYYRGEQRIQTIGLAVPPELRVFEFPLNWPRVTVDTVVQRQHVRSFSLPDDPDSNDYLSEVWESNNMDSQSVLNHLETRVQGHGFVSVGTNEDDIEHPLITVESSRSMIAEIDPRTRKITAALRIYYDPLERAAPTEATLYLPDSTIYLQRVKGWQWAIEDRDDHKLHRVPVVQFLNRPRVGNFVGESEMKDVLKPTDMAARALMDLQVAMETHAVPGKWATGVNKDDFIDAETGKMAASWQAYYTAMTVTQDSSARFGQFQASELTNFKTVIDMLAEQVSSVTGLPMRYFGQNTANPAAEGAIRADEVRLVKNVELKNMTDGDCWADVMALAYRFGKGEWLDGNRIRTDWDDPNTPTFSQKADAIQKLVASGILSREGAWDELGWSQARKDLERQRFDEIDSAQWESLLKPEATNADDGGAGDAQGGSAAGQTPAVGQQQGSGANSQGVATKPV
ncbi:phage portal protein [Bifidobacterium mongoliense]|uniref:Phage portal protein gp6-like protein n=1 Tax=Bifidobacterium mongoliense TaxID=518643 RepID=A0A423UE43_9BIFI|nr:phage portal protein [Bifidobacterium mongoliense]ROT86946.1 phage portal protein gp6-like protein [Bifidobacterium mongoliense]